DPRERADPPGARAPPARRPPARRRHAVRRRGPRAASPLGAAGRAGADAPRGPAGAPGAGGGRALGGGPGGGARGGLRGAGRRLARLERTIYLKPMHPHGLVAFICSLLLGGLAFLIVSRLLPGFRLRGGFGSAVFVAFVYGVIKALLFWVLVALTLPLVVVT